LSHEKDYIFILFMIIANTIYSQSITATVKHILCDANGNLTQEGQVIIYLDPDGVPYSINPITPCQDPPEIILRGLIYSITAEEPVIIGDGTPCPGIHCFDIVANVGTEFECCTSICEEVKKCRSVTTLSNGDIPAEQLYECFSTILAQPEEGRGNIVSENPNVPEDRINDQVTIRSDIFEENSFLNEQSIKLDDVFPNPFNNSIQLNIESSRERTLNTRIVNLSGQIVHIKDIYVSIGDNLKEIGFLARLPSGIYFLVVVDGVSGEEVSTQKIIKSEI